MRPIFSDVTDSNEWSWCHKHVQYLGAEGIISGYPGGLYHPEYLCSRDQMAVYIANAFDLPTSRAGENRTRCNGRLTTASASTSALRGPVGHPSE